VDARPIKGRGASSNPKNRFETLEIEFDPDLDPDELPRPSTVFLDDASRSIITRNSSPDVGFDVSVNPYRGCEHGCSYCYARPFHEYLGFSAGLDFETRILVKRDAPELLRRELASPRWEPKPLAMSGVTDPYQPVERRLEITRRCLEVLVEFRQPLIVITKNHLVTRDVDLLAELARFDAVSVSISLPTLDVELARRLEPRASHPRRRLEAITTLAQAGVPVGVLTAPVIPAITDHELPALVEAAAGAGARFAAYTVLRLPGAVAEIFSDWLATHFPDRKARVLSRLREMRGGRLYDPRFGARMHAQGEFAEQIRRLLEIACRKHGLERRPFSPSAAAFRRPGEQLGLF